MEHITKYPILMLHGVGFRDLKWPLYWGRIPAALRSMGAELYYGQQDSWARVEENAKTVKARIRQILDETGAEKVNIIAHSKGGLEARMAASSLGMGGQIASITTMPYFFAVCRDFSTAWAEAFNRENPDVPGVFYQSYAGVMRSPLSDINLSTANGIVKLIEGANDGLVTVESARWGEKFTLLTGRSRRGVSHYDEIDFRRAPLSYETDGDGVADICGVYRQIVTDLAERGF